MSDGPYLKCTGPTPSAALLDALAGYRQRYATDPRELVTDASGCTAATVQGIPLRAVGWCRPIRGGHNQVTYFAAAGPCGGIVPAPAGPVDVYPTQEELL